MNKTKFKCKKCREEILQSNPTTCPYCGSKEFVSGEEAIQRETEQALAKGRVESIIMECPYCRGTQSITSKSEEIKCRKCQKKYKVPENALELFQIPASDKLRQPK